MIITCSRNECKTTCRCPVKPLSLQIYTARACKQLATEFQMDNSSDYSLNYRSQNAGCLCSHVEHDPAEQQTVCVQTLRISSVSRWVCVGTTQRNLCASSGVLLRQGHLSYLITDRLQQDQPLFLLHFAEQMNLTDGCVTQTPGHQPDYAENNTIE